MSPDFIPATGTSDLGARTEIIVRLSPPNARLDSTV